MISVVDKILPSLYEVERRARGLLGLPNGRHLLFSGYCVKCGVNVEDNPWCTAKPGDRIYGDE